MHCLLTAEATNPLYISCYLRLEVDPKCRALEETSRNTDNEHAKPRQHERSQQEFY